jgi:hypothetical protein
MECHCDIGDIFVARVAGNIVNPDILGGMEYACWAPSMIWKPEKLNFSTHNS